MSAYDPVTDIEAPLGAVGWCVSRGWITEREDLLRAHEAADDVIYAVPPTDPIVRDVVGQASLLTAMYLDKRVLAVQREVDELRIKLIQVGELMAELLAEGES